MADREHLILSATEPDRTGLIAELSGFIGGCGCNVENSRVAVLGGYAGLMFLVSGTPEATARIADGLEQLRERTGIRLLRRRVSRVAAPESTADARYAVEASAIDHEGIIHLLADLVRRHGGNILELETSTASAAMSGEPLFAMEMTVTLPAEGAGVERLTRELRDAAHAEAIELEVRRLDSGATLISTLQAGAVPRGRRALQ